MKKSLPIFVVLTVIIHITNAQQWTRLNQLTAQDVYCLAAQNDTIYAGTNTKIYIGADVTKTWKESAVIPGANGINTIALFNNKIYAGTNNAGVFSSSNNGDSWVAVNTGLGINSISKLITWKSKLYAATYGEGFFVYNETTNQWSSFNDNFYTNVDGNINDFTLYGSTVVAAAGANGIFYKYDTAQNQWGYSYYNTTLRPGMTVNAVQADGNSILAGVTGSHSQALLRSEDGGNTWQTDTVGLGAYFNASQLSSAVDVIKAGIHNNYIVVNSFNGNNAARIFERRKAAAKGKKWNITGSFTNNNFVYTIAEAGSNLYAALNDGLYYLQQSTLPVGLLNLKASKNNDVILLQWQTSSEQNSNYFDIQRSADGIHFTSVGNVKAAGNSTVLRSYAYVDSFSKNSFQTGWYYRVKEVDKDSRVFYSNAVRINTDVNGRLFSIFPNPVKSLFVLQSAQDVPKAVIHIFDAAGRVVYTATQPLYASSAAQINIAGLASGMYILVIDEGNAKTSIKLVKE